MLRSSRSRAEEVRDPVVAAGSSRPARLARDVARRARRAWRAAARAARLAIGIPDYEVYVAHMREHHPGAPPMKPNQSFWLGCRSVGTGDCALSSSKPLTQMFAHCLNSCEKSDLFETLVVHWTLPVFRVSRRSSTRPSRAPL